MPYTFAVELISPPFDLHKSTLASASTLVSQLSLPRMFEPNFIVADESDLISTYGGSCIYRIPTMDASLFSFHMQN